MRDWRAKYSHSADDLLSDARLWRDREYLSVADRKRLVDRFTRTHYGAPIMFTEDGAEIGNLSNWHVSWGVQINRDQGKVIEHYDAANAFERWLNKWIAMRCPVCLFKAMRKTMRFVGNQLVCRHCTKEAYRGCAKFEDNELLEARAASNLLNRARRLNA